MVTMIEIKGKVIIYKVEIDVLGQVNPYLFVDHLAERIIDIIGNKKK